MPNTEPQTLPETKPTVDPLSQSGDKTIDLRDPQAEQAQKAKHAEVVAHEAGRTGLRIDQPRPNPNLLAQPKPEDTKNPLIIPPETVATQAPPPTSAAPGGTATQLAPETPASLIKTEPAIAAGAVPPPEQVTEQPKPKRRLFGLMGPKK